ncbi:tyrosine-protein phosphatase non-receptor type 23 isoform X1 [Carcharodon carcharias]|uniref:tyrosine-protein phosphatase non-receptor type 23 isoform X1 n=1 Tax=Carcharodon carcharias TaxID=13397 RepID=UPI001B7E01CA|nr:tyrosine-protein phosphatase non-receptor type 23 isoform X1 [Carcharodon carcharias]
MEAVPRMPMIWLDLKEAGEFPFASAVRQYILKHYGENPDNYSEELKKLDQLRQSAVNVTRDFEGCSTLRKYFGQLHYLQSRIPMGLGEEAAVPVTWTEIFSGKTVTVDEICYEQACILYNLGALHSMLGAVDNRVTEEGMKVSCTHFQCSAGAFSYLRDHFSHSYSVDMSHQILNLNINLMLGQAQECLLEKSMLDNRKSFLVARISAQVVDYYKEACRALENSETASLIGKFQKDWKKLVQMKIYYYAAVAHLHMGKQAEEQQKYGERLAYFQSSLDKLNEAVKYAKGQPETVQEALRFTTDVIGGKYNAAKKDNDFIYHEAVPPLDSLSSVKGASLVKALPVNPTDPNVTGPDIFAKLVPMEAHEASSLYSEEKAKLLREVMAKIDGKNEVLEQFMDSLRIDPESIDNLDMYNHIPPVLMEKCAALSVRPDTVKNLVQSMQVLSGVYTDVEASLREFKDLIDQDELTEQKFQEATGKRTAPSGASELSKEWSKYMEVHEKASFTNTELHKAMNLHISNLRLLSGPLEDLRAALPTPTVSDEEKGILQNMKRILLKVEEMRDQRSSLIQQLRDTIQKDDITTTLVTTDHSEMKKLFEEQLKKYDQLKVYIDQNLAAQENILKALTDANVKYAAVRKALAEAEHKWNITIQMLVASYEAYEDLMKKSQEGKEFYADLENKVTRLLDKMKDICKSQEDQRQLIMEKELKKKPPPRPTAPKPLHKISDADLESLSSIEDPDMQTFNAAFTFNDLPNELKSLPPNTLAAHTCGMSVDGIGSYPMEPSGFPRLRHSEPEAFLAARTTSAPLQPPFHVQQFHDPASTSRLIHPYFHGGTVPPPGSAGGIVQGPYVGISHSGPPSVSGTSGLPTHRLGPSVSCPVLPRHISASSPPPAYPAVTMIRDPIPGQPRFAPGHLPPRGTSPQHMPNSMSIPASVSHPTSAAGPAVSYGMGQQVSSTVPVPVNTGLHTPPPSVGPTLAYPGQFCGQMPGGNIVPQPNTSTTTVDSIQTPISSFTPDPQSVSGQMNRQPIYDARMRQQPIVPLPGGIGVPPGPTVSAVGQYQYHSGGQPFNQPPQSQFTNVLPSFAGPAQGPQHMFQHPNQVHPNHELHIRPQMHTQQPYQTQFFPQTRPQLQSQLRPQNAAQIPPHSPVPLPVQPQLQGQPQMQPHLRPHLYQHPAQDKVAAPGTPAHSGNVVFPATPSNIQQPGQNIPAAMVPQSQQCHTLPSATESQPMTLLPGSSAQGVSSMPFTSTPPHLHAGSQPALLPNQIGAPQPVSTGHIAVHPVQPVPSSAVGQIQSSAIVPGSPMPPPPAPSPQPSQGQVGTLPAAILPTAIPGSTILQQRPPPSLTPGATAATQSVSEVPFQRQNSSTDLLSSSPDSQHGGPQTTVTQPLLLPTKVDSKEGQKPKGIQIIEKDPYEKPEHVKKLLTELESFKTIVDSMDRPSYGTLTEMDCKWKDLQDAQEKDVRQLSIAVARCYTMKNRHQDIMPYDKNRIIIQSGKDDYINASMIEDLSSYCPRIIATQAPLVGTAADFWLMIYEQKVSLIVMLVSEQEVEKQKVIRYFPTERGQQIVHGPITLTLTTQKITQTHVERMIGLQYRDQSLKRTIIHLQFTSWPELGLPDSKSNLLRFIQEVHGHYLHQRPLHTPVVVHCSSGVRRTGAFCLVYAAVQEVEAGNGIPDLSQIVRKMRQQRKHMLQDKLHLKFCYEAILSHVELVLLRHGVITSFSSKAPSSSSQKVYTRQESQDLVLGGDLPISSIQATIAKLSIKTSAGTIGDGKLNSLPSVDPSFALWSDSQTATLPLPIDNLLQQDLMVEVTSAATEPTTPSQMTPSNRPLAAEINNMSSEICDSTQEEDKMKVSLGNHPATSQPATTNHIMGIDSKTTSLDLLASLTAEAFTLDTNPRNRQKISKHNFLQPQDGQGLQATHTGEDPLSLLDPLWTLNKT